MQKVRRSGRLVAAGATMISVVALGVVLGGSPSQSVAQESTPVGEAVAVGRPVHIHSGNCNNLGDVIYPLTDLTAPTGEAVGQGRRAIVAETSFTNVPATLDSLTAEDHAINAHLSAEEIGTYTACGEIGGVIDANGALVIGLSETDGSGFSGIAYLQPGADGASTDVSLFIAEGLAGGRGGGGGVDEADASPVTGG